AKTNAVPRTIPRFLIPCFFGFMISPSKVCGLAVRRDGFRESLPGHSTQDKLRAATAPATAAPRAQQPPRARVRRQAPEEDPSLYYAQFPPGKGHRDRALGDRAEPGETLLRFATMKLTIGG